MGDSISSGYDRLSDESFVAVPRSCYETCRNLSRLIVEAALKEEKYSQDEANDPIVAVVCDGEPIVDCNGVSYVYEITGRRTPMIVQDKELKSRLVKHIVEDAADMYDVEIFEKAQDKALNN